MAEILTGIIPEDRLDRIRAISAGDPVQGGQPDANGMNPCDNNHVFDLACSAMKIRDDLSQLAERNIYFGYNPNQFYLPFDKVIIREEGSLRRDVYQVYDPAGVRGIDPRDPINRPSGWNATDPTRPYYWLKLPNSGDRGQIGAIVIAMSHQRQENMLPFVGGTFTLKAGLIPWMYEALKGASPNSVTEEVKFGMRENDFMRFFSSSNARELLSLEADAMQRMTGIVNSFATGKTGNIVASGVFNFVDLQTSYFTTTSMNSGIECNFNLDSARQTRVATETRPVNTALTAFIII